MLKMRIFNSLDLQLYRFGENQMRAFLISITLVLQTLWCCAYADEHEEAKISSLPESSQLALAEMSITDETVKVGAVAVRGSSLVLENVTFDLYQGLEIKEVRIESLRRDNSGEASYFSIRLSGISLIDDELDIQFTADTIILEKPSQFVAEILEAAFVRGEFLPFTFKDDLQYRRALIENAQLVFTGDTNCSVFLGRWATNNLNKLELGSSFLDDASLNCTIEGAPFTITIPNSETRKITFGEYPNLLLHHVLSIIEFNGTGKVANKSSDFFEAVIFGLIKNMYFSSIGSLGVSGKSSEIGFNLLGLEGVVGRTSSKVVSRRRGTSIETSAAPIVFTLEISPSEHDTVNDVTKYLNAAEANSLYFRLEREEEYDIESDTITTALNDNSLYLHDSFEVKSGIQLQGVKHFVEQVDRKLEKGSIVGRSVSDVVPDNPELLIHYWRVEIKNLGIVDQAFRVAGYLTGQSPEVLRTQTAAVLQIAPYTSADIIGIEQGKLANWANAVGQFFNTPGILTLELALEEPINVFDLDQDKIEDIVKESLVVGFTETAN